MTRASASVDTARDTRGTIGGLDALLGAFVDVLPEPRAPVRDCLSYKDVVGYFVDDHPGAPGVGGGVVVRRGIPLRGRASRIRRLVSRRRPRGQSAGWIVALVFLDVRSSGATLREALAAARDGDSPAATSAPEAADASAWIDLPLGVSVRVARDETSGDPLGRRVVARTLDDELDDLFGRHDLLLLT